MRRPQTLHPIWPLSHLPLPHLPLPHLPPPHLPLLHLPLPHLPLALAQAFASVVMLAGSFLWAGVVAVFVNASTRAPDQIDFQSTVDQLNAFMSKNAGARTAWLLAPVPCGLTRRGGEEQPMPPHATCPRSKLTRPPASLSVCTHARSRTRVTLTVPQDLRIRLREYFFNTKHLRATGKAQQMMSLMSDTLRAEVGLHINEPPSGGAPLGSPTSDPPLCPPLIPSRFWPAFQVAFMINERWLEGVHFLTDAPKAFLVQLSLAFVAKVLLSLLPPSSFLCCYLTPVPGTFLLSLSFAAQVYAPNEICRPGVLYVIERGLALYEGQLLGAGKVRTVTASAQLPAHTTCPLPPSTRERLEPSTASTHAPGTYFPLPHAISCKFTQSSAQPILRAHRSGERTSS